ncbi:hypothetical protein RHMOL_Rhmol07G0016500 [Rhododendron molle]|uniref:Uncharacterized protein n=1 Tax=Rhododendron molle TaxID=49168 RepID=A0ACC0MW09_RHOML|nr:hypothetical protein RHMOL_Rhmol07G0016500 [Rhododendron molle]
MADTEEGEEPTSRGNEWEVVSLTASAYAAAPGGSDPIVLNDDDKGNAGEEGGAQTSHAMLMSGHFVFPPRKHENLPVEPENIEIQNLLGVEDDVTELGADEGGRSDTKGEENWSIEGLAVPDEFPGIEFFDEKVDRLSIPGNEFNEGTTLQGPNLTEKEQSIYSASDFSSFHGETTTGESNTGENTVIPGQVEPPEGGLDSDISQFPKRSKEDRNDNSEFPCEAWWKRGAASLYAQAKEANTFWSIFIAAAVMGFVVLGQHWQQERWQALQLKWQFSIKDEKLGRMFGPISRFKDAIVGGNRRGSFIRGTSSTER